MLLLLSLASSSSFFLSYATMYHVVLLCVGSSDVPIHLYQWLYFMSFTFFFISVWSHVGLLC